MQNKNKTRQKNFSLIAGDSFPVNIVFQNEFQVGIF